LRYCNAVNVIAQDPVLQERQRGRAVALPILGPECMDADADEPGGVPKAHRMAGLATGPAETFLPHEVEHYSRYEYENDDSDVPN